MNPEEAANGNLRNVTTFQKKSEEVHPITVALILKYHDLGASTPVNLPPVVAPSRRSLTLREVKEKQPSKKINHQEISRLAH